MMLAIDKPSNVVHVQPNLLPCRISHNGPVDASQRYWNPKDEADGLKTAYFRGRKLQGKTTKLPDGYEGVVLQRTDRTILELPKEQAGSIDDDDLDQPEPPREVKIIQQVANFDAVTVWDHEATPVDFENPYLKGVDEWLKLARAIHGDGSATEAGAKTG